MFTHPLGSLRSQVCLAWYCSSFNLFSENEYKASLLLREIGAFPSMTSQEMMTLLAMLDGNCSRSLWGGGFQRSSGLLTKKCRVSNQHRVAPRAC